MDRKYLLQWVRLNFLILATKTQRQVYFNISNKGIWIYCNKLIHLTIYHIKPIKTISDNDSMMCNHIVTLLRFKICQKKNRYINKFFLLIPTHLTFNIGN